VFVSLPFILPPYPFSCRGGGGGKARRVLFSDLRRGTSAKVCDSLMRTRQSREQLCKGDRSSGESRDLAAFNM